MQTIPPMIDLEEGDVARKSHLVPLYLHPTRTLRMTIGAGDYWFEYYQPVAFLFGTGRTLE
jgi:hypothetical protein